MKKLSKLAALLLSAAMVLALAACSGGDANATPTPAADATPTPAAEGDPTEAPSTGESYTVGIIQQMQHVALDSATEGFRDALTDLLGDQVEFQYQNASGDTANCSTIAGSFVASSVDLIMANGTTALQAAVAATGDIPILGTSITEYGVALGIDGFSGTTGINVSGTSDLAPLDQQAAMIQELFPDAETVGLLYCSAEPNSIFQVDTIQGYLEEMGYTCEQYAFTDVNDLASVTQTACDNSDVIYIPTDNTAANNTETIANVVVPAGVPVVAGESGICSGCDVATLSIDYYELGEITGQMAARILRGEESVSEMAIEYDTTLTKLYNAANCEALGITIPEDYEPIA